MAAGKRRQCNLIIREIREEMSCTKARHGSQDGEKISNQPGSVAVVRVEKEYQEEEQSSEDITGSCFLLSIE